MFQKIAFFEFKHLNNLHKIFAYCIYINIFFWKTLIKSKIKLKIIKPINSKGLLIKGVIFLSKNEF